MTMAARSCGSCVSPRLKRFENKTFSVQHDGLSEAVKGLSGWRCGGCDEVEFDPTSARKYASAGDRLVLRAREIERSEIRRIRRKLGLTQTAAARLTGGGHNAFSRYERGEAVPLPAVVNLLKLLDKHPNLLKDLVAS
ncbi:MAG: type II toxin-antitoxin system MqsA family antitoxin [Terriglobales bacterium]